MKCLLFVNFHFILLCSDLFLYAFTIVYKLCNIYHVRFILFGIDFVWFYNNYDKKIMCQHKMHCEMYLATASKAKL